MLLLWVPVTCIICLAHLVLCHTAGLSCVDTRIRSSLDGCLDSAVSALLVLGLIIGSILLSVVLVIQVGEESREAVVAINALVRQKGSEANLTGECKLLTYWVFHGYANGQ